MRHTIFNALAWLLPAGLLFGSAHPAGADIVLAYRLDTGATKAFDVIGVDPDSGKVEFHGPPVLPPSAQLLPGIDAFAIWGHGAGAADEVQVAVFGLQEFRSLKEYRLHVPATIVPMDVWPREPIASVSPDGKLMAWLTSPGGGSGVAIYNLASGQRLHEFSVSYAGSTFPLLAWTADMKGIVLIETISGQVWVHDAADGKLLSTTHIFRPNADSLFPEFRIALPLGPKLYAVALNGSLAARDLSSVASAAVETIVGPVWDGPRHIGPPTVSADQTIFVPILTVTASGENLTTNVVLVDSQQAKPQTRYLRAALPVREGMSLGRRNAVVATNGAGELVTLNAQNGSVQNRFRLGEQLQLIGLVESKSATPASAGAPAAQATAPGAGGAARLWIAIAAAVLVAGAVWLLRRRLKRRAHS